MCAATMLSAPSVWAHELQFRALLSGPNDSPSTSSTGVGTELITMDLDLINMEVQTEFNGLAGNTSSAQIHGRTTVPLSGTAPAAIPLPAFSTGITNGLDQELIDLQPGSAYTQTFIDASGGGVGDALTALIFGLVQGRMYLSINSSAYSGGEIGGFFTIFPDSNDDGVIDSKDFDALAAHFNEFGTDIHTGDSNIDGYTNALDFNAIATNYGQSVSFGSPAPGALIPEPATVLLLFCGAVITRRRAKVA
jgi:hypothetical protein